MMPFEEEVTRFGLGLFRAETDLPMTGTNRAVAPCEAVNPASGFRLELEVVERLIDSFKGGFQRDPRLVPAFG